MDELEIRFPGKNIDYDGNTENFEEQTIYPEVLYTWDGTVIAYEQIFPYLSDAFRFLSQLRTTSAAKALSRLKNDEPDCPSFSFRVHKYSLGESSLPPDTDPNRSIYLDSSITEAEASERHGYMTLFHNPLPDPPSETIDPSLSQTIDLDNMLSQQPMVSGEEAGADKDTSDVENNCSFSIPRVNSGMPPPETPNRETPPLRDTGFSSTSLRSVPGEDLGFASSNDLVPGFPTPVSDPVLPTVQSPKGINRSRRTSSSKLLSKLSKTTSIDKESRKRKSMKVDQRNKRITSELEKLRLSISLLPVANTLYTLPDQDLRALLLGEELIKDGLLEYLNQNSCIWQEKGFWFEDALNLSISAELSAEEKLWQTFQHTRAVAKRRSDQKLRLRMSETQLYLSFETLKWGTQRSIELKTQGNPNQQRASTLSIDHILERSYPDDWNSIDIKTKKSLRTQLHEHIRNGNRCWQVAGALGLGALFACGNLLTRIIKNHSRYTMPKLEAIINYIANAHPCVVSLYHDFDNLVMQIIHMEPLTTWPSTQTIDNKISQLPESGLGPQQVKESWRSVDLIALSQALVEKFCSDRI